MWIEHDDNCAIKRMGNIRAYCDCGFGDGDDMNLVEKMTDQQLVRRSENVFNDNDEIIGLLDLEDFYGKEIEAHITGLYLTMQELAERLKTRNEQMALLSEALEAARMALGEVE